MDQLNGIVRVFVQHWVEDEVVYGQSREMAEVLLTNDRYLFVVKRTFRKILALSYDLYVTATAAR